MTTPKAVLARLLVDCRRHHPVGLTQQLKAAASNSRTIGTWQISAAEGSTAWMLNTITGELFYCGGVLCEASRRSN